MLLCVCDCLSFEFSNFHLILFAFDPFVLSALLVQCLHGVLWKWNTLVRSGFSLAVVQIYAENTEHVNDPFLRTFRITYT